MRELYTEASGPPRGPGVPLCEMRCRVARVRARPALPCVAQPARVNLGSAEGGAGDAGSGRRGARRERGRSCRECTDVEELR